MAETQCSDLVRPPMGLSRCRVDRVLISKAAKTIVPHEDLVSW